MSWLSKSKEEKFIEANADMLVHNLAYHCAAAAKEVVDALNENLPLNLSLDTIFLFFFSLRATIEAQGVEQRFGKRAHQFVIDAIERLYQKTWPGTYSETGAFSQSLMRDATMSMNKSSDPREWIRIHAVRTLETKDPEDELFHLSLATVFSHGQPIVSAVEQGASNMDV